MNNLLLLLLTVSLGAADLASINSFEADFSQSIVNDKNTTLSYEGHVKAKKPQFALWQYTSPVEKTIYISFSKAVIVEPEIEQAYIQRIHSSFNFFTILKNAKKIGDNSFEAVFQDKKYKLNIVNDKLVSIKYQDELDNRVIILFSHQKHDIEIVDTEFIPDIPLNYDVIKG